MLDSKYSTLIKEVREISSDIARMDRDLSVDRHDLADSRVQMATLTEEVKQLRNEMAAITKDVGDKVKETMKPAQVDIGKLSQEIKKKETVTVTVGFIDWVKQKFHV